MVFALKHVDIVSWQQLTFISTFLLFKLRRICNLRWSTIGVNIFIQFSFRGENRFGGTGILRNSGRPLWNKGNKFDATNTCIKKGEAQIRSEDSLA